jgi:hypothetical protein
VRRNQVPGNFEACNFQWVRVSMLFLTVHCPARVRKLDGERRHMQPHACPSIIFSPLPSLCLQVAARVAVQPCHPLPPLPLPLPLSCPCSIRTCSGPQLAAESEKLQAPYLVLVLVRVARLALPPAVQPANVNTKIAQAEEVHGGGAAWARCTANQARCYRREIHDGKPRQKQQREKHQK